MAEDNRLFDSNLNEIPNDYLCPISRELMKDPVVTADGETYDRESIEKWFLAHNSSPMTNLSLPHKNLIPNNRLKSLINEFRHHQKLHDMRQAHIDLVSASNFHAGRSVLANSSGFFALSNNRANVGQVPKEISFDHNNLNFFHALIDLVAANKSLLLYPNLSLGVGFNTTFLKHSGTVYACGNNQYRQLGVGHNNNCPEFIPVVQGRVLQMISGKSHSFILTEKALFACGNNEYGQLGLGSKNECTEFTQIPNIRSKILQVVTGAFHSFLVTEQGLFACGKNDKGQLGLCNNRNYSEFTPVNDVPGKVLQMATSENHSLLLTEQGLFGCGDNSFGQLGLKNNAYNKFTQILSVRSKVLQIAVGAYHSLLLTEEGLFGCGSNEVGQLGLGLLNKEYTEFTLIPPREYSRVLQVAAGAFHSLLVTDEGLYTCGNNKYGQLGLIHNNNCTRFVSVHVPGKLLQVLAGSNHSVVFTERGLFACGLNSEGQLGLDYPNNCNKFERIKKLPIEVNDFLDLFNHVQTIKQQENTEQEEIPLILLPD